MAVSTFTLPNPTTQLVTDYLSSVDGDISVMSRVAAAFAPRQNEPAALNIVVDAGPVFSGTTLTEIPAQITPAITPPTANARIDRVVIDRNTGLVSVVTGTQSATPTPPALPDGTVPIARINLIPGVTAITNAMIVDERALLPVGAPAGGSLLNVRVFTSSGTYSPTPGTNSVIVEVYGGGGSGGGCVAPPSGQGAAGSGGGSGAFASGRFTSGFENGVNVTVGAGGPSNGPGRAGSSGGTSSFGSLISAPGGTAGELGTAVVPPNVSAMRGGAGDAPVGGNLLRGFGTTGGMGIVFSPTSAVGGDGGSSAYSGGSYGSIDGNGHDGNGTSIREVSGGSGGGGGCSIAGDSARSGGQGSDGIVIVYEYA